MCFLVHLAEYKKGNPAGEKVWFGQGTSHLARSGITLIQNGKSSVWEVELSKVPMGH